MVTKRSSRNSVTYASITSLVSCTKFTYHRLRVYKELLQTKLLDRTFININDPQTEEYKDYLENSIKREKRLLQRLQKSLKEIIIG